MVSSGDDITFFENLTEEDLDRSQSKKRTRIRKIVRFLFEEKEITQTKFFGIFSMQGLMKKTLANYLEDLQNAEMIIINNGIIKWIANPINNPIFTINEQLDETY